MQKNRRNKGFTIAELLVVVAILVALFGLAFISVPTYMRSLKQTEMDGVAKEVFVAAQNHLSIAAKEGYLSRSDFGTAGTGEDGVYYFAVSDPDQFRDADSILDLLLPPASVDDTVRLGGSYIIRYHKPTAQVLDVFYAEKNGRYAYSFDGTEYADLLSDYTDYYDSNKQLVSRKEERKAYNGGDSVIGWYGGVEAANLVMNETLLEPEIVVTNAEKLTVTVTDPNGSNANAKLTLYVTGKTSGNTVAIELTNTDASYKFKPFFSAPTSVGTNKVYTVTLDDISANLHFNTLSNLNGSDQLIPGEDLEIRAVSTSKDVNHPSVPATSARKTANSLFGDGTTTTTAKIENFRHLENLNVAVSNVSTAGDVVKITNAEQTANLSWTDFTDAINAANGSTEMHVYRANGNPYDAANCYVPVDFSGLTYNGNGKKVSNVTANAVGDAGLFGTLTGGTIRDLELVDFSITGSTGAGALAGSTSGTSVIGVAAYRTAGGSASIRGYGAGGLIGSMTGGSVTLSAAAVTVRSVSSAAAGGLVGTTSGGSVTNSYSGGQTVSGRYSASTLNVTSDSGSAGGLIGSAGSTAVNGCYSTCSAKGATNAGGLIGAVDGGSVTGCYATGLVQGGSAAGALVGSGSAGSASGNYYFRIINEGMAAGLTAAAIDENLASYRAFVTLSAAAAPYDTSLTAAYGGRYALKTISQLTGANTYDFLTTHYGDWPAPETLVPNAKS